MSDRYIQDRRPGRESRCKFERTLKGEYCPEEGAVKLHGLTLCDRHADRLRLEERVTYWRAILAHMELWSGRHAGGAGEMWCACSRSSERECWWSSSVPLK